jgi:hypothetical protein
MRGVSWLVFGNAGLAGAGVAVFAGRVKRFAGAAGEVFPDGLGEELVKRKAFLPRNLKEAGEILNGERDSGGAQEFLGNPIWDGCGVVFPAVDTGAGAGAKKFGHLLAGETAVFANLEELGCCHKKKLRRFYDFRKLLFDELRNQYILGQITTISANDRYS